MKPYNGDNFDRFIKIIAVMGGVLLVLFLLSDGIFILLARR